MVPALPVPCFVVLERGLLGEAGEDGGHPRGAAFPADVDFFGTGFIAGGEQPVDKGHEAGSGAGKEFVEQGGGFGLQTKQQTG